MRLLMIAALFCSLYIPPGPSYIIGTSHYLHKYPQEGELKWSSSVGAWIMGPVTVTSTSPGHPIGHEIMILGGASIQCGEVPYPTEIFSDGFETGDTGAWMHSTE